MMNPGPPMARRPGLGIEKPTSSNFDTRSYTASESAPQRPSPSRLRLLAKRLHSLGERPPYEWLLELSQGADPWERLERYADLAPLAAFIVSLDGDRLAPPRLVSGGRQ
jgi:hypothetical protein